MEIDPVLPPKLPVIGDGQKSCAEASLAPSWVVTDLKTSIGRCCFAMSPVVFLSATVTNEAAGIKGYCSVVSFTELGSRPVWEWNTANCYNDSSWDHLIPPDLASTTISYDDRRGVVAISQEWTCPGDNS